MQRIAMSNTPGGLPLTSSRVEEIFPILTPAQINRIAVHGHTRAIHTDEVLVEQGESAVSLLSYQVNLRLYVLRAQAKHLSPFMAPANSQVKSLCSLAAEV